MAPRKPPAQLKRVQASDVERWLRDAWQGHAQYPDPRRCHQLALRINVIVDRHNARRESSRADAAIRERRQDYQIARTRARTLNQELQRTLQNLHDEQKAWMNAGLQPIDGDLAQFIAVTARTLAAVDTFLALPPPERFHDHADNIKWIAEAAEEAWTDLAAASAGEKKFPFGHTPGSPLTSFVRSVLEGIRWTSEDQPAPTMDTISDHLRGRHNRPRPPRRSSPGPGEK